MTPKPFPSLAHRLLLVGGPALCLVATLIAPSWALAASVGKKIPITSASKAARADFKEGQYLLDVGRGVEARDKFKAAVAKDPSFAYAYYNTSNAALSFAEFKQTLDAAEKNLEGKSEGEKLLVKINQTFLTNDSDQGLELAQKLVQQYPRSPRAHLALAGIQATRNENEAARESMKQALRLEPKSAAAIFTLGNSYLFGEPKDFRKAELYMREFIKDYPDEAKAYEGLGDVKRAQKDLEAAEAAYTQATDKDPTLAVAQLKKGHVNSILGNIDKARAAYDAAVESARPENKAAYATFRAFTHIHEGDVQGSLDELAELAASVETMGTPPDQVKGVTIFALNSLATAALHTGKLDEAAKAITQRNELTRAIGDEVGTDDSRRLQEANCLMWDGLLAAYQGDYDRARAKAEENAKLLESDSNPRKMEAYHQVLGTASLLQKDYSNAVEHLEQANHLNNMYIRYQLARALEGAGKTAEAKKLYREVAEWNFNSVGFALVHEDAGDRASG